MSTKLLREQERLDNRDKRLQSILDAGRELFAERGLAAVNMKEIAEKALISRATLYRYFPCKEDLALAIEHYFYREILLPQYKEQLSKAEGSGFDKVAFHFRLILGSYRLYPDYYKFTGAFDHYFNYRQQPEELAKEMNRIFNKDFDVDPMVTFIQEGIDDGSIKADLDPYLTAKTIDQTLLSLCQRMAVRREEVELEFQIENSDDLIENLISILLNGIKND